MHEEGFDLWGLLQEFLEGHADLAGDADAGVGPGGPYLSDRTTEAFLGWGVGQGAFDADGADAARAALRDATATLPE